MKVNEMKTFLIHKPLIAKKKKLTETICLQYYSNVK